MAEAVNDPIWQDFRKGLKGLATSTKLRRLSEYARSHRGERAKVQVSNYRNALRRAGLLGVRR